MTERCQGKKVTSLYIKDPESALRTEGADKELWDRAVGENTILIH